MPSFEESLKKLETIVDQLEKGDLALEQSLTLFEEGVGLSASCKSELDAAEGKVQMLVKQRDGSLKPEPFLTEKPFRFLQFAAPSMPGAPGSDFRTWDRTLAPGTPSEVFDPLQEPHLHRS
jgi:exodeoxyribonuclease VII small subunit